MRTDVTQIKPIEVQSGYPISHIVMPIEVYEELRLFCRQHGETDLPGFLHVTAPKMTEEVSARLTMNDKNELLANLEHPPSNPDDE